MCPVIVSRKHYKCMRVIDDICRGKLYTMEDYANFLSVYGQYVFRREHLNLGRDKDDPDKDVIFRCFEMFAQITEHYMRPASDLDTTVRGTHASAEHGAALTKSLASYMEEK